MLKRVTSVFLMGLFLAVVTGPAWAAFDEDHKEKINGTMLHFRVRGADKANPYLLILHGGPGFSAHMFYPWGPSIESALNVVYLDQRGCGESERIKIANSFLPKPEEIRDVTIANMVKDIEGVRDFLKVEKWVVLGHSWGGMLGLEYVSAHREHVSGYIHMDGLVSQPMAQDAIFDAAEASLKRDLNGNDKAKKEAAKPKLELLKKNRAQPPSMMRLMTAYQSAYALFGELYYADAKVGMTFQKRLAEAIQPYNISLALLAPANEPGVALSVNDDYPKRDDRPLLAKIAVPTLIINGKQDGVIPPKTAELAHAGIKDSKLLLLDSCGHFPFAEQPEKTTEAVLEFVKSLK